MTSPPVSGSSAGGASGSIAPSSGATPVSGESSLPPEAGLRAAPIFDRRRAARLPAAARAAAAVRRCQHPAREHRHGRDDQRKRRRRRADRRAHEPRLLERLQYGRLVPGHDANGHAHALGDQTLPPEALYRESMHIYDLDNLPGTPSLVAGRHAAQARSRAGGRPRLVRQVLGSHLAFRARSSANGSNCTQGNGPDTLAASSR